MPVPFIIERTFNVPKQKVWSAITNNEEMRKWYFDLPEFKAQEGFEFSFLGGKEADKPYTHLCRVTEVVEGSKITYSWEYKGYKGVSFVTFELFAEGNRTRLRLTHAGLESFAVNRNPDFDPNNFVEGWTHIIGVSLKEYLEKETAAG